MEEGFDEGVEKVAIYMLKSGMSTQEEMSLTGLSQQQVMIY